MRKKIAATLASTGTPAFFVHPGEASHGDLGMISSNDIVLTISNSGTSAEILTLYPVMERVGIPVIAMTGNPQSAMATLAKNPPLYCGLERSLSVRISANLKHYRNLSDG